MHSNHTSKITTTRISTCLPTSIYLKLVNDLKSPYSLAPAGQLDKGVLAKWITDSALSTINNTSYKDLLEKFIHAKDLSEEFKIFFQKEAGNVSELI